VSRLWIIVPAVLVAALIDDARGVSGSQAATLDGLRA
jgi:hypothetical protein